jgi:hypothetical protein
MSKPLTHPGFNRTATSPVSRNMADCVAYVNVGDVLYFELGIDFSSTGFPPDRSLVDLRTALESIGLRVVDLSAERGAVVGRVQAVRGHDSIRGVLSNIVGMATSAGFNIYKGAGSIYVVARSRPDGYGVNGLKRLFALVARYWR